jgi:DNA-binding response OmpR family regulator
MPEHPEADWRRSVGRPAKSQAVKRRELSRDTAAHVCHKVGLDENLRGRDERRAKCNATRQALLAEPAIDEGGVIETRRYFELLERRERRRSQVAVARRVTLAHDNHDLILEQLRRRKTLALVFHDAERQIQVTAVETLRKVERPARPDREAHGGRDRRHCCGEARRDEKSGVVVERQVEAPIGRRGFEHHWLEGGSQFGQCVAKRLSQRLGAGRRGHAGWSSHEELVADQITQSAERVAHSRLTQSNAGPGSGDAALAHDRVEDGQQVQVERAQIHNGYVCVRTIHFKHEPHPSMSSRTSWRWRGGFRQRVLARVLVIDSDDAVRREVISILGAAGHETIEANNGDRGLRLFYAEAPDLVITAIFVSDRDGLEVIADIRRAAYDGPIIAISGGRASRRALYLRVARMLGADDSLAEPFSASELVESIERLFARGGEGRMQQLLESIHDETDPERKKTLIALLAEELAKHPARSEFVRRRTIERLIELIYDETIADCRVALTALLAAEEAAGLAKGDRP